VLRPAADIICGPINETADTIEADDFPLCIEAKQIADQRKRSASLG